jgi:hypothetical protein
VWHFTERNAEYESKRAAEIEELHRTREEAIKNRDNPKRKLVRVARPGGGEITLYIGAYVHAHRRRRGRSQVWRRRWLYAQEL